MPTPRLFATLASALAVFLVPALTVAEEAPSLRDIGSVRSLGKANATIGYASDTDAVRVNPAGISASTKLNIDLGGFFGVPQHFYALSLQAVDSKINSDENIPVSGGIGYQYLVAGEGFEARKGHVLSLALAVPLYPELMFVGVTGRYLHFSGGVVSNAVTMDASVMAKPVKMLGITAAGYNLIDVHSVEARRSWGFGVAVGSEELFHVDVDARLDTNAEGTLKPTFSIGGEVLIADIVAPRLGYSEDMLRGAHLIAGGVSVIYDGFALDVGYRHAILGDERTFAVAVRMLNF
ncbi:MAG: hypothetical protein HY901_12655 [Deltaproteobacteria bacterium]|nr:hypothetical protein [Deltaproteobacteria bacterium]